MNYKSSNKYNDAQKNINTNKNYVPLTKRMRPNNLNDYVGQSHVIGPKTVLYNLLKTDVIPSMIVWGPPGCGKDALVNVIIEENKKLCDGLITLIELSASTASINDIKKAVKEAKTTSNQTIVIMNEIHKFNKLQQDIFLPHVEAGTFILIGITIENPFSLNSALLSRCRIFMLNKLQKDDLISILSKAVKSINGEIILKSKNANEINVTTSFFIDQEVIAWLAEMCDGDCKIALNGLESAVEAKVSNIDKSTKPINLNISDMKCSLTAIQATNIKQSDNIYQMHSALHHCIIGDDENAALYWLARIMETGEDPVYIAKRLVRVASEDIDFDDEDAVTTAIHTMQACQMIGMPECDVFLAQCVVYLSRAEKSKEILNALQESKSIIENHKGPQPKVPSFIKAKLEKNKLGSSYEDKEYKENSNKSYLPKGLEDLNFF